MIYVAYQYNKFKMDSILIRNHPQKLRRDDVSLKELIVDSVHTDHPTRLFTKILGIVRMSSPAYTRYPPPLPKEKL